MKLNVLVDVVSVQIEEEEQNVSVKRIWKRSNLLLLLFHVRVVLLEINSIFLFF